MDVKMKRLGRGLSGLLNAPVAVSIPPTELAGDSVRFGRAAAEPSAPQITSAARAQHEADEHADAQRGILKIDLGAIVPNKYQPRKHFDSVGLNELATSIRSAGVMQPVLVRAAPQSGIAGGEARVYELIAGERRWRAAKLAGLNQIPAILTSLSDEDAASWALIENLQREDLGPIERAHAFRALAEQFSLTQEQIAERVGIDRVSVSNTIRLLELEQVILDLVESRALSFGHAKVLLSVSAGADRVALAARCSGEGWSVRRLEQEIKTPSATGHDGAATAGVEDIGGTPASSARITDREAGIQDLERRLGEHLGTQVKLRVNGHGNKGRVIISFYDLDHFDGLMQRMGFRT